MQDKFRKIIYTRAFMNNILLRCTLSIFVLLMLPFHVFADDRMYMDPFYSQSVNKDRSPVDTISEHVDPFSGHLSVVQTDIHLPGNGGLDLNVVRTYNSNIWGRQDNVNPGFLLQYEPSPVGVGWSMHMGILRNPRGNGSNNNNWLPNNPVFELPDGSQQVFYKVVNTTNFISKDFWTMTVTYLGAYQDVYTITAPDGTVYTAELGTGNAGYKLYDNRLIAQVTSIRNAAGNATINIAYYKQNVDGMYYINTITDTVGRVVKFNYLSNMLDNITVNGRVFKYTYVSMNYSASSYNYLETFKAPNIDNWTYTYEQTTNTYQLNSINFPAGGKISYTYDNRSFAVGITTALFRVVTSKTTSNVPAGGTWTYTYNSCDNSNGYAATTRVTAPGVTEKYSYYGWCNTGNNYVWKVGLPISKEYSGNLSLSEVYTWGKGIKISDDSLSSASWSGASGVYSDLGIYVPFLTSKAVTRDNKTYTTTYDLARYDQYGNPESITETGDKTRHRSVDYYWHNTPKNIVRGKPHTETITGDFSGTSTTTQLYDINSGHPTEINKDGVVTKYNYLNTSRNSGKGDGNLYWVKWTKDSTTYTTTYLWTNGMVSQKQNPLYIEKRTINPKGYVADEENGRGYTTTYKYDDNLRLTDILPYDGNPDVKSNNTHIDYLPDASEKTITRGGYWITYTYDGFGRPTGSTDIKGVTTTISYNAYGVKTQTTSNIGDTTDYDYFGRPTKVTDKDSHYETYNYSAVNNLTTVTVTDKNNKSYSLTYNAFGDPDEKYLVAVKDQMSKPTNYARNIQGKITSISQGNISRSFDYDDPVHPTRKAFLMSETNPETGTITYGRDEVGNMTSKTDSSGTKYFIYDALNRLRCISLTDICSGNDRIEYDYDNADNRTTVSSPAASIVYYYDEFNRQYKKDETIAGKIYTTGYHHNGNDYVDRITYPSGRIITYGYNSKNEVTYVTGFGGSISSESDPIQYNTAGLPKTFDYLVGTSTVSNNIIDYNGRQLITSISAGSAISIGYGYDSRGNLESFTSNLFPNGNQSFTYDDVSRLKTFNGSWGIGEYDYDPDGLGNRTSKTINGTTSTIYKYNINNSNNRLDSATGSEQAIYEYNDNGTLKNGTWGGVDYVLYYDKFDNLASTLSGTTLATYGYDGDGMRVTKASSGKTIAYHYDQAGKILSESYSDGGPIADYIYLNGKLVAKVATMPAISIAPTSKSFGIVYNGSFSPSQTVSVTNTGTDGLTISSLAFSGTNSGDFEISSNLCTQPLAHNATCSVQVKFAPKVLAPSESKMRTAQLEISSNDSATPKATVSLEGYGLEVGKYAITATAGPNGTITPKGIVAVASGGNQTFIIKPNSGYLIETVYVDDNDKGKLANYPFIDVTAHHSISATFTFDTTPPTGSVVINGGAATTTSAAVNLTLTCSDEGGCSQMRFSSGESNQSWTDPEPFSPAKSWGLGRLGNMIGDHTVFVQFSDVAGNWSQPVSSTINLVLSYTIPLYADANGYVYSTETNGQLIGYISPYNFTGSEALHIDASGAVFDITDIYFFTDPHLSLLGYANRSSFNNSLMLSRSAGGRVKTADTGVFVGYISTGGVAINGGATSTYSMAVSLSMKCGSSASCTQMRFSNDGVNWSTAETFAPTKSWSISSGAGAKTVYVQLQDGAGNWQSVSSTINYVTDDITPPVTIASPSGGVYNSTQTVSLSCGDGSGSGCSRIYYTTDGSVPDMAASSFLEGSVGRLSIVPPATLNYFAVDAAGNIETNKIQIYALQTYPISTSIGFPGFGGTISPASATVAHGGSQTFTVTPDAGFVITDVKADGVSKGAATSYSFTNVTAGHTLSASFATTCAVTVKNSRTGTIYATLQAAYDDAALLTGDTILVTGNQLTENFTASGKDISITIDGGYKCDFSANPYTTIITGAPRISSGSVKLKNIRVKQ
jgi:YD repeat-containing protein